MISVAILDYGVGNLFSMSNALDRAGLMGKIIRDPTKITSADAIVLPGVGNFGPASLKLQPFAKSLWSAFEDEIPILGSCLGMQLLFEQSEESPEDGLGLLNGTVRRFQGKLKVPHMGWNTIKSTRKSPLLKGIPDGEFFYFVHSYYPQPTESDVTLAVTDYGGAFSSIVERGSLYGCQFHPEKSGKAGARLLSNFASIVRGRKK